MVPSTPKEEGRARGEGALMARSTDDGHRGRLSIPEPKRPGAARRTCGFASSDLVSIDRNNLGDTTTMAQGQMNPIQPEKVELLIAPSK